MGNKRVVYSILVVVVVAVGLVLFHGGLGRSPDPELYAERTANVFDSLKAGNYQSALMDFSKQCQAKMSPQQLGSKWAELTTKMGLLQSYRIMVAEPVQNSNAYKVEVKCTFEKGSMAALVVFDNASRQVIQFRLLDINPR